MTRPASSTPRLLALAALLVALSPAAAPAGRVDAYADWLRTRGLGRLAESHLRRESQRDDLTDAEALETALAWSALRADEALATPPGADASRAWDRANEPLARLASERPEAPRLLIARLQLALNAAAEGAALDDLDLLREAADAMGRTADAIERLRRVGDEAGGFSQSEIESLANRVALTQGETLLAVGERLPADSADRDDALLRALMTVEPLSKKRLPAPVLLRAQLAELRSRRLLGRLAVATEQLARWLQAHAEPAARSALNAERVRLLLAGGEREQALQAIEERKRSQAPPHDEFDLAEVEALAAVWREAEGAARRRHAETIREALAQGESRHGGSWARRAERLAGEALLDMTAGDAESLSVAAAYLYRMGRSAEAVERYDRAASAAYNAGGRGRAFELAIAAAAITAQRGEHAHAAERFRRAALSNSDHPRAAEAHRAAWLAAMQGLRAKPGDKPVAERCLALLEEHTGAWPESPSAADAARLRLGLLAGLSRWDQLLAALGRLPADEAATPATIELTARAYEGKVAGAAAAESIALIAEATATLQPVITGKANSWPPSWSDSQRRCALALGRIHLARGAAGAEYAAQLLGVAVAGSPKPSAAWLAEALPVLAQAQVTLGQIGEARTTLSRISGREGFAAPRLVESLVARLAMADGGVADRSEQRREVAELLLSVVDPLLEDESLQEAATDENQSLRRGRAVALGALGREGEAVAQLETLAAERPDDGATQRALAAQLARSASAASRERALGLWRKIEARSRRGGAGWVEARVARLRLLVALGRTEEAAKLLRLTRLLAGNSLDAKANASLDAIEALLPEP
ncbi:hypothetical protein Mal64_13300 [Pseudobythopirellula maris]|uniref:Tetratricopeptide repeat protein n=1 Tax=Pseudobythopirellula maris TaxID=2527991 RepID=A0A5C5ZVG4_9BACT|nr:hypothetical protein [Pseudobythopirellula maris]TWT90931.1 hypothetical protein Mal64_13300 [Pseudobythopirellula maris]